MKNEDGRKLDHKTLEEIRIRAVRRVEAGESPETVIQALGFSRPRIYEWLALYREGGVDALRAKPISGRPPKLSGKQLAWVYGAVVGKSPQQYRFPFALWTRWMVRELILREFDVRLSEVSVGRLLKKMGLSVQKPLRRAYQRNPEAVERWKNEEFPAIRKEAKKAGAEIFFGDESNVRSDYHSGTTWAPKGQTPVVEKTGARFGINLVSAISPRGSFRFMTFEGRMDAGKFCEFLGRLLVNAEKPIFLILDSHPVHRSTKVRKYAEDTKGKLKLFFLPSYSPDLNPDELVWNHLKNHKIGRQSVRGPDDLKKRVLSALRSLQKLPGKVRGFFRHPDVSYVL